MKKKNTLSPAVEEHWWMSRLSELIEKVDQRIGQRDFQKIQDY